MTIEDDRRGPQPAGGPGVTRFAARGGHRLSYESSGAVEGAPVLGLHDLLADRGQLRPLAAALVGDGFRVTLPDARGHGASSAISGREYPARELVADAVAVLDAEGQATVHVVAMGWGAGTALAMAAVKPERVSSLVLIEPYLPGLLANWVASGFWSGSLGQAACRGDACVARVPSSDNAVPESHVHVPSLTNIGLGAVPAARGGEGDASVAPTDAARHQGDAQAHPNAIQGAADAAARGQTDRALDLYFGARMGVAWRDRLPKTRFAAARRSAVNLGPLLSGAMAAPMDGRALTAITVPVTLLLREDAPANELRTVEVLAGGVPGARVERVSSEAGEPADLGPMWISALSRVLKGAR